MTRFRFKLAALTALTAAAATGISPAMAADLPAVSILAAPVGEAGSAWSPQDDIAFNHDRYRYGRNRVSAGDVLAGVLIIGGIAAVASAANKSAQRNRDYRYPGDRYPGGSYPGGYDDRSSTGESGLDRAASLCVRAIERDARVGSVDGVNRDASGFRVTGTLFDGQAFTCRIGNDGRISGIDYTGQGERWDEIGAGENRQYDDDRYRRAWADLGADRDASEMAQGSSAQPAYPGGPLPGEEIDDDY